MTATGFASPGDAKHRTIRSFTLRQGRYTRAQKQALETLWPRYGIEFSATPLDFGALFGGKGPVVLEIGFGNGDSLLAQAQARPDTGFLGIEVHGPGVGHLLHRMAEHAVGNIRLIRHDAIEVLTQMIADHSLDGVQLFFPDPWPKKRHHKRRIVQPAFADLIARKLKAGGFIHMATDWENYAEHMLAVFDAHPAFANTAGIGPYAPGPGQRPQTKFERRGLRLGHGVHDLVFTLRQTPS